jgi:hypothetical protein
LQGKSQRKIFPTQEIEETRPDGSLIVSLKVGNFGEIRETLKAWLPNVRILAPKHLGKQKGTVPFFLRIRLRATARQDLTPLFPQVTGICSCFFHWMAI